jgi:hypothetical protein
MNGVYAVHRTDPCSALPRASGHEAVVRLNSVMFQGRTAGSSQRHATGRPILPPSIVEGSESVVAWPGDRR